MSTGNLKFIDVVGSDVRSVVEELEAEGYELITIYPEVKTSTAQLTGFYIVVVRERNK